MSNLSLLFASKVCGGSMGSGGVGETFSPGARPEAAETAWSDARSIPSGGDTLPSGIASMEHWLDLNA